LTGALGGMLYHQFGVNHASVDKYWRLQIAKQHNKTKINIIGRIIFYEA
jgi:hypothetical protein